MTTSNYLEGETALRLFVNSDYFDTAEKLAKIKVPAKISEQIKEFIASCPELPSLEDINADQNDPQEIYRKVQKPIQLLMKKKNQQIILALGHFLILSEGEFMNEIVPFLLKALNLLKYAYYSQSYEAFLTALMTILCQVVIHVKDESQTDLIFTLASSIIDVFRESPVDSAESALFKISSAVKILRWRSKILEGKASDGDSFYDHTDFSEGQEVLAMLSNTFFTNFDEAKTKKEREKREKRQQTEQEREEKREKKAKDDLARKEMKALESEKGKEVREIKAKEEQDQKDKEREERRKRKEARKAAEDLEKKEKERERKEREKEKKEERKLESLEKKEQRVKAKEAKKELKEAEKAEKEIKKYEEKKEKEKQQAEKKEKTEKERAERRDKAEKERIEKEKERAERKEKAEKEKAEKGLKVKSKTGDKNQSPQKSTSPSLRQSSGVSLTSSGDAPLETELIEMKLEDEESDRRREKKAAGLGKIKVSRGFGKSLRSLRKSSRANRRTKNSSQLHAQRSSTKISETDFMVYAIQQAAECAHSQPSLTSKVLQFYKDFMVPSNPPTKTFSFYDLLLLTSSEAARGPVFKTILQCILEFVLRINPSEAGKGISISNSTISSTKKIGKSSKLSIFLLLENLTKSLLKYGHFFTGPLDPWSDASEAPVASPTTTLTGTGPEPSVSEINALNNLQVQKPFYERLKTILTHFILASYTLLNGQLNDDGGYEKALRLILAHLLQSNNLEGFNVGQNLMVLGLYHTQTILLSGSFKDVFAYLENKWIMDSPVGSSITEISDKLFTNFVSMGNASQLTADQLEEQALLLLVCLCSRDDIVRDFAKTYLIGIIKEFPIILWNRRCLATLLDIVEIADVSADHGPKLYVTKSANPRSRAGVADPLPAGVEAAIQKTVSTVFDEWISTCMQLAPTETRDHLRVIGAKYQAPYLIHNGFSRAIQTRFTSNAGAGLALFGRDKEDPSDDFANFFNVERLEAIYSGEVSGMLSVLKGFDAGNKVDKAMLNRLEKQITVLLSQVVRKQKEVDLNTFTSLMYRAAAFLIQTKKEKVYQDIIHLICRAPAVIFTTAAMLVATSVWRWIMITCPDLQAAMLVEIREAWAFTMESRKGLYANIDGDNELFSAKPAEVFTFDDVQPHRIFIEFLRERFVVSRQNLEIFAILRKAVSQPHLITTHSVAFGARFRLVHFCLQYTQTARIDEGLIDQSNFRGNVYTTALSWFESGRKWYDPKNTRVLVKDREILMDVCRILSGADKAQPDSGPKRTPRGLNRSPSTFEFLGGGSQDDSSSKPTKMSKEPVTKKRSMSFSIQRTPEVAPEKSPFNPKRSAHTDTEQRANLILLLLQNEIERIVAWHNPLQTNDKLPYLKFKKIEKESLWNRYLSWAWDFSPNLAIQFVARFNLPHLVKNLEKRILDNPGSLVKVPSALPYLITANSSSEKKPVLKYLRRWALIDPLSALPFLQKEFTNSYVTEYALRSLNILPPDGLIFFLPQLVQALRYDRERVSKFLLEYAERNEIVAHQIIWIANAYSEEPELGKIVAEIAAKIKDIAPKTNEFTFFEEFTALSGKLKSVAASERKAHLREQLEIMSKDLAVDDSIYLPTNPDSIVCGIEPEKSSPMQSAEKTPILVTFKTFERPRPTLKPEEKDKKKKKIITKACIFKVGDDVRQDILALQLIEVFKRIMESAGLDLFLYPYKVIATAPGCGIIECVPNAKSRDALGKESKQELFGYFEHKYGNNTEQFITARTNFIKSMAAYAVVSYVLQIKDRHNGNILVDTDGHIVHIDFGFLFDSSPGGNAKFERAPFKLSAEMLRLLGGEKDTEYFTLFSIQCVKAFLAVREHLDTIVGLVGLMLDTKLPCFFPKTIANLKERLAAGKSEKEAVEFMIKRIMESVGSVSTWLYDWFQAKSNKIYY